MGKLDELTDWKRGDKLFIWTKDKRAKLRTGLKEARGQETEKSWKMQKKQKRKSASRCLDGFTKSSKSPWQCHGNSRMFPDPELHSIRVAAHRDSLPHSLQILWIWAEISCCGTLLLFWRLEGHNLQWDPNTWRNQPRYLWAANTVCPEKN